MTQAKQIYIVNASQMCVYRTGIGDSIFRLPNESSCMRAMNIVQQQHTIYFNHSVKAYHWNVFKSDQKSNKKKLHRSTMGDADSLNSIEKVNAMMQQKKKTGSDDVVAALFMLLIWQRQQLYCGGILSNGSLFYVAHFFPSEKLCLLPACISRLCARMSPNSYVNIGASFCQFAVCCLPVSYIIII